LLNGPLKLPNTKRQTNQSVSFFAHLFILFTFFFKKKRKERKEKKVVGKKGVSVN